MNPKFRRGLARRMTIEVLLARHPRYPRGSLEGLAMMVDDFGKEQLEDEDYVKHPRDPVVEFVTVEGDMLAALEALDTLGFQLMKLENGALAQEDVEADGLA
jgi:hypothetical protein